MVYLLQNSVKVLIWANITCSIGVLMSVVLEVISLITLKNYGIFYVQVAFYGKNITDLKLYSFFKHSILICKAFTWCNTEPENPKDVQNVYFGRCSTQHFNMNNEMLSTKS